MAIYKWAIFRQAAVHYCRLHWIMQEVQALGSPISMYLPTNIEYKNLKIYQLHNFPYK